MLHSISRFAETAVAYFNPCQHVEFCHPADNFSEAVLVGQSELQYLHVSVNKQL